MKKSTLGIGLVGLALIGGGGFWFSQAKKAPTITYTTAPADRGHLQSKVTATGAISALVTVQVGSQVSGRLSQVLVDYNSEVKRGQVLARLEPQLFEAELERARANHTSAQSSLTRARLDARQYVGQRMIGGGSRALVIAPGGRVLLAVHHAGQLIGKVIELVLDVLHRTARLTLRLALRARLIFVGLLADDGVQPLAQSHAGTTRGMLGGFPGLAVDALYTPWNTRLHARPHPLSPRLAPHGGWRPLNSPKS